MKKQISIGAIISYIAVLFNIISGVLYTPWMVRTIGDSNYALYSLATSIIGMFMVDFGLGSSCIRFLSNYYAEGREQEANNFLGIIMKLYLRIAIVILLVLSVLYFFIENIYVKLSASEVLIFKNLYLIVAFYSVVSFPLMNLYGVLIAKERFVSLKVCGLLQKILSTTLIVIALLTGGNVYELVFVNAGSNIFFSGVKLILVKRTGVKFNLKYKNKDLQKKLLGFTSWVTVAEFIQRYTVSLTPTLLAIYVNTKEIAYFSLAVCINGFILMIGDALNSFFIPKVAQLNVGDNPNKSILHLMCFVGKFQLFIIGMIVVVFSLIGQDFVKVWLGDGYDRVAVCTMLIIIPLIWDIPQQIGKQTVMVRNEVKMQAYIHIMMLVIYLPCLMYLSPRYGTVGAAIALMISYFARLFMSSVLYHCKLHLNMFEFFKKVYFRWIWVATITLFIGFFVLKWIATDGIINFLIRGVVCTTIYILLFVTIGLDKKEKIGIIEFFKRREHVT